MPSEVGKQSLWLCGVEGLSANTAGYEGSILEYSRRPRSLLVVRGILVQVCLDCDVLLDPAVPRTILATVTKRVLMFRSGYSIVDLSSMPDAIIKVCQQGHLDSQDWGTTNERTDPYKHCKDRCEVHLKP